MGCRRPGDRRDRAPAKSRSSTKHQTLNAKHRMRATRLASCLLLLALTAAAPAQDNAKPAGLRIFYTGHSFHMFVPPQVDLLVKAAGIEGHQTVGRQGIGGSRVIQHWEKA